MTMIEQMDQLQRLMSSLVGRVVDLEDKVSRMQDLLMVAGLEGLNERETTDRQGNCSGAELAEDSVTKAVLSGLSRSEEA